MATHTILIEIPDWGPVTIIEAVWLLAGVFAFTFASLRLRPLLRDYGGAKETHEQDLYVIARGYIRRELVRLMQALCILSIGFYSAVTPQASPGPTRISLVGFGITVMLIVIAFLVSFQSYLDWRDREEVRRILEVRP
jgi:phosphate/sulfate permease